MLPVSVTFLNLKEKPLVYDIIYPLSAPKAFWLMLRLCLVKQTGVLLTADTHKKIFEISSLEFLILHRICSKLSPFLTALLTSMYNFNVKASLITQAVKRQDL